jgi:hypothetical protein
MTATHGEHVSKVEISKLEKTLINRVSQLTKPTLFDVVVSEDELQYSVRALMKLASDDYSFVSSYYQQVSRVPYHTLVPFVEIIGWDEDVSDGVVKMKLDESTIHQIESIISETQLVGRHLTIDGVFKLPLVDQAKTFGSVALGILLSLIVRACQDDEEYLYFASAYVRKVFSNRKPLILKLYYVPLNMVYVVNPDEYSHLSCYSEMAITVTFDYRGITSDGFGASIKDRTINNQRTVSDETLDECR